MVDGSVLRAEPTDACHSLSLGEGVFFCCFFVFLLLRAEARARLGHWMGARGLGEGRDGWEWAPMAHCVCEAELFPWEATVCDFSF